MGDRGKRDMVPLEVETLIEKGQQRPVVVT